MVRIVTDVSIIADQIQTAGPRDGRLGKVIFFIGAGCSISAKIPGATGIAQIMAVERACRLGLCDENANCDEAYKLLVETGRLCACLKDGGEIDWYEVSAMMFRDHYSSPDRVRELYGDVVRKADGAINWAHLCLGELVAHGYVSTVLTTNFDRLVLSGIVRTGLLPVICDGIESLNRITGEPRHPQLVEIHGSLHTYVLRNAQEDLEVVGRHPQASAKIRDLLQDADTFVAIGYGGREQGVMDLLIQAAKEYPDKNLFWVNRSKRPEDISDKVRQFLATSRNAWLCPDQDADLFFLNLCKSKSLRIGAPQSILDPLMTLERLIEKVSKSHAAESDDIKAVINAATDRLNRLKNCDTQAQERDVEATRMSEIREKRLAGDFAQAFKLAKRLNILPPMY